MLQTFYSVHEGVYVILHAVAIVVAARRLPDPEWLEDTLPGDTIGDCAALLEGDGTDDGIYGLGEDCVCPRGSETVGLGLISQTQTQRIASKTHVLR